MLWISLSILVISMLLGLPIYISLLISSLFVLAALGVPYTMIVASLYDGVFKYTLLAVPFFLLAGCLIEKTEISTNLIKYVTKSTRRIRGGTSISGVIANEFFGAISGSSAAATGTIGKMLFPIIKKHDGEKFSLGLLTAAGSLAIVMPPSITMILYATSANVSVGKLFLTGIIPAIIIGVLLSAYIVFRSSPVTTEHNCNRLSDSTANKRSFKDFTTAASILFLPILVLGGIYLGIFTPTESAAVSVFYVIIILQFVFKEFKKELVTNSLKDSLKLTTQIFIVIACSSVFSQALTMAQVPQELISMTENLSPLAFMILINLILLITGMFFDPASAVLVLMPIFAPIANALNIDLIYFGIVVTVNIAIGMFTPPFGLNLFVSQAVFDKPLEEIVRSLFPFWVVFLVALVIITYFPSLYMWLPKLL